MKHKIILTVIFLLIVFVLVLTTNSVIAQDTLQKRFLSKTNYAELQIGRQSKYLDVNINYFKKLDMGPWYGGFDIGMNYNTISVGPRIGLQYTCRFLSFKTDLISGYMLKDKTFKTYFNPRIGIHFKHRIFLYYGYCISLYKTNSVDNFKGNNINLAYRIAIK